ncbi:DUF6221 family protein [Streptomyces sp. NPDC088746]|uniref:DUF6221 family protein n=1 Tax=Streptomyces sp. NPDC088746 TaxID=3365885 RepID=UPI0037F12F13
MDDLVQFLRARLDDDSAAARAASWDEDGDRWDTQHQGQWSVIDHTDDGVIEVPPHAANDAGVAQHMARHDPARVLREVEAHRLLLKRYDEPETSPDLPDSMNKLTSGVQRQVLADVFRVLALPYADHPDYQETWKP